MIVELESPYNVYLTAEQQAIIASHAINAPKLRKEGDGVALEWGHILVVSIDVLPQFPGWKVLRTIDNASTRALMRFGERTNTVVNERCHVAVAGLGLLTINEVEAHTDLCTDALNALLREGWRIVAVCVQPDQRRPDYVLGRSVAP